LTEKTPRRTPAARAPATNAMTRGGDKAIAATSTKAKQLGKRRN
jgi:hypothetical protein